MIIETRMTDIVTREQFIDACPAELKKRIDDFFVFYSQKKKSNVFSGPPETGKKFYKDQGKFEKKNNMTSFKKPFEKKVSEFEKALIDFKGILSKLNENNQDDYFEDLFWGISTLMPTKMVGLPLDLLVRKIQIVLRIRLKKFHHHCINIVETVVCICHNM